MQHKHDKDKKIIKNKSHRTKGRPPLFGVFWCFLWGGGGGEFSSLCSVHSSLSYSCYFLLFLGFLSDAQSRRKRTSAPRLAPRVDPRVPPRERPQERPRQHPRGLRFPVSSPSRTPHESSHEASHEGVHGSAHESVHSSGRGSLVLFSPVLFLDQFPAANSSPFFSMLLLGINKKRFWSHLLHDCLSLSY